MSRSSVEGRVLADLAAVTYRIDPSRSGISFTTGHLFGLGRVTGTFDLTDGEIQVAHPIELSQVTAMIAAGSVTTGNARRDGDVGSARFLDVEVYPDIAFTSDRLIVVDGGTTVPGVLTVHGVSRPLTLLVDRVHGGGAELSLHGRARIDRYAFGITAARGMAGRFLDVALQVTAFTDDVLDVR